MRILGIKYQLRIASLIPVLLVAMLFAIFYNGQFNKDLKQHRLKLGEAYIRQLIPAAQLALINKDNRTLQGLINASTINPEIKALAFYNDKGQLIAFRGGKHSLKKPFKVPEFVGDYIKSKQIKPYSINFIAPIIIPKFNLYSNHSNTSTSDSAFLQSHRVLGWLSIEVGTQSLLIKRYQMYIVTIFITLLGLLVSLTIHYFLSKNIYLPIVRLRKSMRQILNNVLETPIKTLSFGEMGTIEKGCVHLQKKYLEITKELNHHIEVATADLQQSLELLEEKNIQLSLEKRKIEEKNKQSLEFITNMSHEIRTPMNGVIGFTNVLLESNLDSLQLDYVKTIKFSAQDLLNIINDILDYSKMDAGKLKLDCIPLDVRACIDEVIALTNPEAHKKGIDLIPVTEINVPKMVLGDPLRLKQILSNLITNAIKFTDNGYVIIRTFIEHETSHHYCLSFSIKDTGIGISKEDQLKLFNAFNQVDISITRRFGGSGLGLVICKKLVETMNGKIHLVSEIHQGSTFTAQLTIEKFASYEIEKYQSHPFSHIKVLCFDDNPLYLEAMCNGLRYWGVECVVITQLSQLEQAFSHHYDCHFALINVNQGCEHAVKTILMQQTMSTVLVSKWPIANPHELGAQAFLFKPISIQKLYETIQVILGHRLQAHGIPNKLVCLRKELKLLYPSILIAEDNPVNKILLESLLKNYAQIDTVDNGEQALERCQENRYQIILLDLHMPKVDGLNAAETIRSHSRLNYQTPIVLISANYPNNISKSFVDLCLQKPIDEAVLIQHLIELLSLKSKSAINWELSLQKVSGNQALAYEFLHHFVQELKQNRQEFVSLFEQQNLKALEQLAHKLHGACGFCGVTSLQQSVIIVEKQASLVTDTEALKEPFMIMLACIDEVIAEYHQLTNAAVV